MKPILLLVPFLAACGPILMYGEKAASDCSDLSWEEMEKESFRLVQRDGAIERGVRVQLQVYRDCRVNPGTNLSSLQVKNIFFRDPTSRVPELVLELTESDSDGNALECTAPFELGRGMVFACPEGYYYELLPEN